MYPMRKTLSLNMRIATFMHAYNVEHAHEFVLIGTQMKSLQCRWVMGEALHSVGIFQLFSPQTEVPQ